MFSQLMSSRRFAPLFWSQLLAALNDNLLKNALAMLVVYLSWFGPLWWFGVSRPLVMVACAATTVLCLIYVASYRAAASRRRSTPLAAQGRLASLGFGSGGGT